MEEKNFKNTFKYSQPRETTNKTHGFCVNVNLKTYRKEKRKVKTFTLFNAFDRVGKIHMKLRSPVSTLSFRIRDIFTLPKTSQTT